MSLNFPFFNGMGAAMIAIGVSSALFFRRLDKRLVLNEGTADKRGTH